jgi:hypothetical protein
MKIVEENEYDGGIQFLYVLGWASLEQHLQWMHRFF